MKTTRNPERELIASLSKPPTRPECASAVSEVLASLEPVSPASTLRDLQLRLRLRIALRLLTQR